MLISCSKQVKVELSCILSYLMFVTPISLPLKPISRSTAVVLFSLLESMGRFGTLIHPSLQIGVFHKFDNLFLYIHSKTVKNEKKY